MLRCANLDTDQAIVEQARDVAQYLLDNGDRPEYMAIVDAHLTRWLGGREEFLKV
jgi:ATP-dependent DNA helicase RecG